jgi:PAS domain S-box-containing protein
MNDVRETGLPSPAAPGSDSAHMKHGSRQLLVVDDEEIICQIVQGFLGVEGWEVDSVRDVASAYASLERRSYPVILCDVHLPGNSTELLKFVKSQCPATQVIMFTGDPTINTAREAIQHGAYEYVPKPCRREELVHIIQRAFEKYSLLEEQSRLLAENEAYRKRLEELVQKRTEQLRQSELRYRAVFNRAVDAIFLVDAATGVICDHNIAATRFLNVGGNDLMDRPIRDFIGNQMADALNHMADRPQREWRFERVTFSLRDQKSRVAQVSVGTVVLEDQTCLQIVARDMTDQIELRERSELMEMELLSEQRLAAIGLLASGIAHNINTPLMGIYGAAQLIKMKHPELKDFTDVDGVITQVERINGIVRNLMWKSRQEQDTSVQEINLNQLLQEELRFLEADLDFKHNVTKQFSFADEVPVIMGRYSDFSQSIMNVVRNALDAMHTSEQKQLTVRTAVNDGEIRIVVKDNGCGMRPEDRDKIFLPFYTTKPIAGQNGPSEPTGTGLGLSTVQRLLAPYSVHFQIDSEPGQGTTFSICVPVAPNSPSSRKEASRSVN